MRDGFEKKHFLVEKIKENIDVEIIDELLMRLLQAPIEKERFKKEEKAKDSFFRFFKAITSTISCEMRHPCYNSFLYKPYL